MYVGSFSSVADVIKEFNIPSGSLDGAEILYAEYEAGGYEGSAFVLFRRDGKLYEVNGSHCSCYGLEGSWDPEETSVEALAKRDQWRVGCSAMPALLLSLVPSAGETAVQEAPSHGKTR